MIVLGLHVLLLLVHLVVVHRMIAGLLVVHVVRVVGVLLGVGLLVVRSVVELHQVVMEGLVPRFRFWLVVRLGGSHQLLKTDG